VSALRSKTPAKVAKIRPSKKFRWSRNNRARVSVESRGGISRSTSLL
jgi:hypothetical protein